MDKLYRGVPDNPTEVQQMIDGASAGYRQIIYPILIAAELLVRRAEQGAMQEEIDFHMDTLRGALRGNE